MGELLWTPSQERIEKSNIRRFMAMVNEKSGKHFTEYDKLYQWSVQNIPDFWAMMWDFAGIRASRTYDRVVDDLDKMPGAAWFAGARLNFAENLLRFRDDHPALIFRGEDRAGRTVTYAGLYDEVARVAKALRELGVTPGDRVAGFMPNMPETAVAMLAATSLGATWSSCSPDFGIKGVLDRFGQIKPKVVFTANGYWFKGKKLDSLGRIASTLKELPSVEKVIVVSYTDAAPDVGAIDNAVLYQDFRSPEADLEIEFEQLPAEHPLYVMYSSGTTGLPKCMVQGAAGVLVNHQKEHLLHTDLTREDTIFYFTTCGWMMWNWLMSSLAVGASLVLYDGNPFYPDAGALWKLAEDTKTTVFGISAAYISALQNAGLRPGRDYDLSSIKTILSTGGPLAEEGFEYVYKEVKADVLLSSISGGTDINGCFAAGSPTLPVYAGEIQCRGLGMKVEAYDEEGRPVINQEGELVCSAPSPSMPIYFWDDPDGKRYRAAYFEQYPNVWRHGDFVRINDQGGVIISGRSDATLNPGGVRIGTAEIYRQVDLLEEIQDSLVVAQDWKDDVRIVLFVVMAEGRELSDELKDRIKKTIRSNASPRHVPKKILAVPDIPYTLNQKKVELAVKKLLKGQEVKNRDALRNPDALDHFVGLKELEED